MKKVINGTLYNTETARKLGGWSNTYNYRDFNYCEETLYRTKSGKFFIHGEGGAMSKYAQTISSNEWSGGEKIIPLSAQNAMKWAEEHLEADEYERIFGEVTEDESKKVVTYSLPASTIEKVKRIAAEQGISLSEVIERAISAL